MILKSLKYLIMVSAVSAYYGETHLTAQISPGPLARAHADLEGITNCTRCHELGQKISSKKCLECHTLIRDRINQNKGYHASKSVRSKNCIECHKDHLGRDFQMIEWENDKENFNHSQTGYVLEGKHKNIPCESCHKVSRIRDQAVKQRQSDGLRLEKTFLGLSTACINCHFDEHRGQIKRDCYDCHDYNDWKKSANEKFDHSNTQYPLLGRHSLVACIQCHPLIQDKRKKEDGTDDAGYYKYKIANFGQCISCHKDPHAGKFGSTCQKCHTAGGWKNLTISGFDHSKTAFPLNGRHQSVDCNQCHQPDRKKPAIYSNMKYQQCTDCHRDVHGGQLSHRDDKGKCEACHTVAGFVPSTFTVQRHNTETGYPLLGAHDTVACRSCHTRTNKETFMARTGIKIQADTATLMLRFRAPTCYSCHRDIHQGQFRDKIEKHDCAACHTTNRWTESRFDHNRDSRFPLTGKHASLRCDQCHKWIDKNTDQQRILYRPLSVFCESCHKDVHEGQLADYPAASEQHPMTDCGKCHNTTAFKPAIFDHAVHSRFALTGAHARTDCNKCHIQTKIKSDTLIPLYKPIDVNCASCHPDAHNGVFEKK